MTAMSDKNNARKNAVNEWRKIPSDAGSRVVTLDGSSERLLTQEVNQRLADLTASRAHLSMIL
jgi:hypothetical protein